MGHGRIGLDGEEEAFDEKEAPTNQPINQPTSNQSEGVLVCGAGDSNDKNSCELEGCSSIVGHLNCRHFCEDGRGEDGEVSIWRQLMSTGHGYDRCFHHYYC